MSNKFIFSIKLYLIPFLFLFFLTNCKVVGEEDEELFILDNSTSYLVTLENKSNFTITDVRIYTSGNSFVNQSSFISSNLASGSSISDNLSKGTYLLTIFRQLNQYSDTYAFTTNEVFRIDSNTEIEYFDFFFRIKNSSGTYRIGL